MAKRKHRKVEDKFEYTNEIVGVLLILLSIACCFYLQAILYHFY